MRQIPSALSALICHNHRSREHDSRSEQICALGVAQTRTESAEVWSQIQHNDAAAGRVTE